MLPTVVIAGRPNVGKSTRFNRLVGRRDAIVSDTSGVTRDRKELVCEWRNRRFLLIDTGGIDVAEKDVEARNAVTNPDSEAGDDRTYTVSGLTAGTRYRMRQKLLSIGDDYWIENDRGERAYKVNGKAFRVRQTFVLENPSGDEVARIQERKLSIRDKIAIERASPATASASITWRARLAKGPTMP